MGREIIGYQIVDSKTGQQVGATYTYENRKRARSRADRYSARPIFAEVA